jgi:diacylglycerol kinase (ATP)
VRPAIETILSYDYPRIRVILDGEVISETAQYAIVGNCKYSAGLFPATRRAEPDDGLFDVCLVGDLHPLRLLELAFGVWRRNFPDRKDVVYLRGREVVFEPADGGVVPLQVDGDPAGRLPASFVIEPAALSVIAPGIL